MFKPLLFAVLITMFVLAGCAPLVVYPTYKDTVKVSVSGSVPAIPAGAYVFDNSQVALSSQLPGATFLLPAYFGLAGALVYTGFATVASASVVPDAKSSLMVKFDSELKEALLRNASREPYASRFKFSVTMSEKLEDLSLLPSALFITKDGGYARLWVKVDASFKDQWGGMHFKYYWSRDDILPFSGTGGWTGDDGALFRRATARALDRIAEVILRDLAGECNKPGDQGKQRDIQWKPLDEKDPRTSILLCEGTDYFVTGSSQWMYIVDRSLEPIVSGQELGQ